MSIADDKAMVRRLFEEDVNALRYAVLDDLVAPDFVLHSAILGEVHGREAHKQSVRALLDPCLDFRASAGPGSERESRQYAAVRYPAGNSGHSPGVDHYAEGLDAEGVLEGGGWGTASLLWDQGSGKSEVRVPSRTRLERCFPTAPDCVEQDVALCQDLGADIASLDEAPSLAREESEVLAEMDRLWPVFAPSTVHGGRPAPR